MRMLRVSLTDSEHPRHISQVCLRLTLLLLWLPVAAAQTDLVGDVGQLTGEQTRVVWVQDQSPDNGDTIVTGKLLKLMGFDSHDGQGERPILTVVQNYAKPLFTPDGNQIVFSDRYQKECFVVNWDGSGRRRLGKGFAIEVWEDPLSGKTWVYACTQVGKLDSFNFRTVRRILLDGGKDWETVWDKTEISPDNFQLSADGTRAAGEFPWPHGGTADLSHGTFRKRADGCWASLAPDSSGLCWIFDGPHRNLYLYPPDSKDGWMVPINTVPGFESHEVFHPRWSNHCRYICMTGPYKVKTDLNTIDGGGPEVEVYAGRFSKDFRSVQSWARITRNNRGDFHPDLWVHGGKQSTVPAEVLKVPEKELTAAMEWPGTTDGLVFLWDNAAAPNMIPEAATLPARASRVEAHGSARFGRFFEMNCTGGSFIAEQSGSEMLEAFRRTNELTIEATITTETIASGKSLSLITYGTDRSANFELIQLNDQFSFQLKPGQDGVARDATAPLGHLMPGRVQHLVITLENDGLKCYLNGALASSEGNFSGDFSVWSEQPLVFGGRRKGKAGWSGTLEGIAVYNRAITPEEASSHYRAFQQRLETRDEVSRWRIRAKCLETTAIPDPRTIVPYRRALIVHRFLVEKVRTGVLDEAEILVAQWGILDKNVVAESRLRVGQSIDLTIEQFDDHPELRSERQLNDIETIDLPLYYHVD